MSCSERFDLTGRVALVSGAARGIGETCARGLGQAGARLALADVRADLLEPTAQRLAAELGTQVEWYECDVTDSAAVDGLVHGVQERCGALDVLLNCAGICIHSPAEAMSDEQWEAVLRVNLTGAFYQSRAAGRVMLAQGRGSIIHIASMSGSIVNVPQPQAAYNASKAGLIQLARSLASEWAGRGVRVNTLSPGYTLSEMTRMASHLFGEWEPLIPQGRLAEPEELVGAVVYLASDASSYTTGHDLVVDGGYMVR